SDDNGLAPGYRHAGRVRRQTGAPFLEGARAMKRIRHRPFLETLEGRVQLSLASAVNYEASPQGVGLNGLVAADFNGDGLPDLAVVAGDSVRAFLNQGGGTVDPGTSHRLGGTP